MREGRSVRADLGYSDVGVGDDRSVRADMDEVLAELRAEPRIEECVEGASLLIGDECEVAGIGRLSVTSDGRGRLLPWTSNEGAPHQIVIDVIPGEGALGFHATLIDGDWKIIMARAWTSVGDCNAEQTVEPGEYCVWRGGQFRVYGTELYRPGSTVTRGGYARWLGTSPASSETHATSNIKVRDRDGSVAFAASLADSGVFQWMIETALPDGQSAVEVDDGADVAPPTICESGLQIEVGESCTYAGFGEFGVDVDGAVFPSADAPARRGWVQADWVIGGEHHTFQAVEESDSRWRIYAAGLWQPVEGRDCAVGGGVEPGEYCVWRGNVFRVYATNDLVTDREHAVQFTEGYAHLDLQFWPDGYDDQLISVTDEFEDKQGNPATRKFIAQRDPESDTRSWIIVCAD